MRLSDIQAVSTLTDFDRLLISQRVGANYKVRLVPLSVLKQSADSNYMKTVALNTLEVGSLVKDPNTKYYDSTVIWRVLEHGHDGDPSASTTLEAKNIISLKPFDAKEATNTDSDRKLYGNARYAVADIRQWLNSDEEEWYSAQHDYDAPPTADNVLDTANPYATEAGFLTNFSVDMAAALLPTTKLTVKSTVDGGNWESVVDQKVFLLSTTEVGLINENDIAEGSIYAFYEEGTTNDIRIKTLTAAAASNSNYDSAAAVADAAWPWTLRTVDSSMSYGVRAVNDEGGLTSGNPAYHGGYGISPAICIPQSTLVYETPDENGVYTLAF